MIRKGFISSLAAALLCLFAVSFAPSVAHAASFTHGPYLIDMSETEVTMMWYTDVDATGTVEYGTGGSYTSSTTETKQGLVSVGKRHSVRLTGLTKGTTYNYRVVSTPVTDLKAYYPVSGTPITSAGYTFTTFNDDKSNFSFYYLTDTHEDITRINNLLTVGEEAGADRSDFVMHTGDPVNSVESESQIFSTLLDPIVNHFAKSKPLMYVHGNHDMRGHYARQLYDYLPNSTGEWYYGFNHGPASFVVVDSSEDKDDSHPEYGGLISTESYRTAEKAWFENYVSSSAFQSNPFKILMMHQRDFGMQSDDADWIQAANDAGIQLALVGHNHVRVHVWPGQQHGNKFHMLILGQDEIAKVKVSSNTILVTILDDAGNIIDGFEVNQTPNVNTDFSGHNFAAERTVTASSSYESVNWSVANLTNMTRNSVSGNLGWCSEGNSTAASTEWIQVDLGESRTLSRVDLYPRNDVGYVGAGFPVDFTIQLSNDNINWTTVATETGYTQPGNSAQGFPFSETSARYIKVTATKLSLVGSKYSMQLHQIEAYGSNLAEHRTITASSSMELGEYGWGAQAATDGITQMSYNSSYGWSSNSNLTTSHTEWMTVDLGGNSTISHVNLYPRNDFPSQLGNGFPIDFTIQTSTDNTNWTTVVTETNYAKPGDQVQSFSFATTTARYVKVTGTKLRQNTVDNNYYMQFAEIKAY